MKRKQFTKHKKKNPKLYKYSMGEDRANWISHLVGLVFAAVAIIIITVKSAMSGEVNYVLSSLAFALGMATMFLCSMLYHMLKKPPTRSFWRKMDHSAIFIMILGSFAPICFVAVNTSTSHFIFVLLSITSLIGIILKWFFAGRFKLLSTLIYMAMGWSSVFLMGELGHYSSIALTLILLHGAAYTIGAILYVFAKFKYNHLIWHISINVAIIFMFIAIYGFII